MTGSEHCREAERLPAEARTTAQESVMESSLGSQQPIVRV